MTYEVTVEGELYRVSLTRSGSGWQCEVNGVTRVLDVAPPEPDVLSLLFQGRAYEVRRERSAGEEQTQLFIRGRRYRAEVRDPRALRSRRERVGSAEGPRSLLAPMPGKVVRILAPAGTEVDAGQPVLVIEAMKMQNEIKAPKAGRVQKILATDGTAVNAGDVLAIVV